MSCIVETPTYSAEIIVNGLRHFDDLAAVCERTEYPLHSNQLKAVPEELWCTYIDLKKALGLLPVQQRRAIYCHVIVGQTEEEAAAEMRLSRRALRDRVRAGLINLRKILGSSG